MKRTLILLLVLLFPKTGSAGDWPQLLGPDRNGIARDEQLFESWPASGPKVLWSASIGTGFSGPVIKGDRVYLFHRIEGKEQIAAYDTKSGEQVWESSFDSAFIPAIVDDDGPRSTPALSADALIAFSPEGYLRCLELKDGALRWELGPPKKYTSPNSYFGAGTSPIVVGKNVIVNWGDDRNNAGIVAISLDKGEVVWKNTREIESYSSPTLAKSDGVEHLIFVTRLNAISIDPQGGDVRFQFPFGERGPTVNAASPIVHDGHLFLTASYGIGARWVKLKKSEGEVLWENDELMSSQYTTPILFENHLIGIHGREDQGTASLVCINPTTQERVWSEEGFGSAHLIRAGDFLLIQKRTGEIVLARANTKKYQGLREVRLGRGDCRAVPALSQGIFYFRDSQKLHAIEVGKSLKPQ